MGTERQRDISPNTKIMAVVRETLVAMRETRSIDPREHDVIVSIPRATAI
jgi:hypothetical protein